MEDILTKTQRGGGSTEDLTDDQLQLIVFKLAKEEYALSIDQIKEVVQTPNISRVPRSEPYVKGIANIRGSLIAILDLEEKFGLISEEQKSDSQQGKYTLVIESEKYKMGILVKKVPNTLTVNKANIDDSSSIIQYSDVDKTSMIGIVKDGDRMIILLDMVKMMDHMESNSLIPQK